MILDKKMFNSEIRQSKYSYPRLDIGDIDNCGNYKGLYMGILWEPYKAYMNYADFKNLEGLTPEEYMRKADDLLSTTKDITKSSFAIAGLGDSDRLANDADRITELMKAANSAEGQKAVLQAGVNMAAEQTKVLLELRTLLASSLKTQNAEEMRRLQNEKAVLEHRKKVFKFDDYDTSEKADLMKRKW